MKSNMIRLTLAGALMVFTAISVSAASLNEIKGTWASVREYSKIGQPNPTSQEFQMKMQLQFDEQSHFSLKHTLTALNSSDSQESLYTGEYLIQGNQILANASDLEMTNQGGQIHLPLKPARLVLMEIISLSPDSMTIQMAGEDLYIDFQRLPAAP